jgi:hypothetical protein
LDADERGEGEVESPDARSGSREASGGEEVMGGRGGGADRSGVEACPLPLPSSYSYPSSPAPAPRGSARLREAKPVESPYATAAVARALDADERGEGEEVESARVDSCGARSESGEALGGEGQDDDGETVMGAGGGGGADRAGWESSGRSEDSRPSPEVAGSEAEDSGCEAFS